MRTRAVTSGRAFRGGFTLAELLVATAIAVVLVAMLLPAFKAARDGARKSACAANLHQLGAGFLLYAADHDGDIPQEHIGPEATDAKWYPNNLLPYISVGKWSAWTYGNVQAGVWRCPAVQAVWWGGGYGVNVTHLSPTGAPVKLQQIRRPAQLWMIGDAWRTGWSPKNSSWICVSCPVETHWGSGDKTEAAPRHQGRSNVCFVDGHVEAWLYADLKANKNDIFGHNGF